VKITLALYSIQLNMVSDAAEHFDISHYWINKLQFLPYFSQQALRALRPNVPVPYAVADGAFSS